MSGVWRRWPVLVAGVAILVLTVSLASPWSQAQEQEQEQEQATTEAFDGDQEQAIRVIVRKYLVDNPEVLIEAMQVYQRRQRAEDEARQREQVAALAGTIDGNALVPVLGNPEGDVLVVEFFDYRCPYCKKVVDDLRAVVEEDGRIRLAMMELPILGQDSVFAARVALAAIKQDGYHDFHYALMRAQGTLSEDVVFAIAQEVGLDVDRLRDDIEDKAINDALRANHRAAQNLNITGTPAFIIGGKVVPGAIGIDQLRQLVRVARSKSS